VKKVRTRASVYRELLKSGWWIAAAGGSDRYSVHLVERAVPSGSTST